MNYRSLLQVIISLLVTLELVVPSLPSCWSCRPIVGDLVFVVLTLSSVVIRENGGANRLAGFQGDRFSYLFYAHPIIMKQKKKQTGKAERVN